MRHRKLDSGLLIPDEPSLCDFIPANVTGGFFGGGGGAGGGNPPPPAQYWRLRFPDGSVSDANYVAVREIEMALTVGGADITSSVSSDCFASSIDGVVNNALQAFQNDTDDWFCASGSQANAWIANNLGSAQDPMEIRVIGTNQNIAYPPETIIVEYSFDASTWYIDNRWPTVASQTWAYGNSSNYGSRKLLRRVDSRRLVHRAAPHNSVENSDGWTGFTLRQVMRVPGPGTRLRWAVQAGSSQGVGIGPCYAGIWAGSGYDFATTPVQCLFGGATTIGSAGASAVHTADDVTLTIANGDHIVVSMYVYTNSTADMFRRGDALFSGNTAGFKSGNSASSVTVTGYTAQNRNYFTTFEVWDPAA